MAPRKKAITEPKEMPSAEMANKELPSTSMPAKELPSPSRAEKALPPVGLPENTVMIGGKPIEIKPTKLKYQRNRTAAFYRMIDMYPLMDIMAMSPGTFGDDRDGDKAIMDWLIAATDDEQLILDHYDEMDTDTIERILVIFKRINKIDDKAEKLKNLERTAKKD